MIGWACFGALCAAWVWLVGGRALRQRRSHQLIGRLAPALPGSLERLALRPPRCAACAPPNICPREGCPECKRPAPTGYTDIKTGVYHPPPWALAETDDPGPPARPPWFREVPMPRPLLGYTRAELEHARGKVSDIDWATYLRGDSRRARELRRFCRSHGLPEDGRTPPAMPLPSDGLPRSG